MTARTAPLSPLLLAAFVMCADQAGKWIVLQSDLPQSPYVVAPFLRLVYAENTGAAFSFLADSGEWAQWLLRGFSIAACVFLLGWILRRPPRGESFALSLVLGGAAGNLIDRFRLGYVVDFIDVHWGAYHWPAFNIADSAITIGVLLLIWRLCFAKQTSPPDNS